MQGWGTPLTYTYADGEHACTLPARTNVCTSAQVRLASCKQTSNAGAHHCLIHPPPANPASCAAGVTYNCQTHCSMADRDGRFEHRAPIIYDPKTGGCPPGCRITSVALGPQGGPPTCLHVCTHLRVPACAAKLRRCKPPCHLLELLLICLFP